MTENILSQRSMHACRKSMHTATLYIATRLGTTMPGCARPDYLSASSVRQRRHPRSRSPSSISAYPTETRRAVGRPPGSPWTRHRCRSRAAGRHPSRCRLRATPSGPFQSPEGMRWPAADARPWPGGSSSPRGLGRRGARRTERDPVARLDSVGSGAAATRAEREPGRSRSRAALQETSLASIATASPGSSSGISSRSAASPQTASAHR